jgi:hypothetical protein
MKLRLESFGELRLIDLAGRPVAFPEKDLLAICWIVICRTEPGANIRARRWLGFCGTAMTIPTSWPTCARAYHAFRRADTELGTELLVFTATGVRIKPDAFVCDLSELANADSEGALEKLRRLVGVLRQDFLAVLADQSVGGRLCTLRISDWPVPDCFEWWPDLIWNNRRKLYFDSVYLCRRMVR